MTLGERAADRMKAALSTWRALLGTIAFVIAWIATSGLGTDPPPYIGLNLILSCFAALQCFVLLIAARRSDQISSDLAQRDYETGRLDLAADQETNDLVRKVLAEVQALRAQVSADK